MRHRIAGVSLVIALGMCSVVVAEDLKSGPQVGSSKIPAFNPKHVNGPDAGKSVCLV
jgi:hypothetical protein